MLIHEYGMQCGGGGHQWNLQEIPIRKSSKCDQMTLQTMYCPIVWDETFTVAVISTSIRMNVPTTG